MLSCMYGAKYLAVLDLEPIGLTEAEAKVLTQRLTSKMIELSDYIVVERANINKILKEQKFQHSGCTDSECAVEIGQLLNADVSVIGTVSKFGNTYTMDCRIINVESGSALQSASFTHTGEIDELVKGGIESISHQLLSIPYKKKMQRVDTRVTSNYGITSEIDSYTQGAKIYTGSLSGWVNFEGTEPKKKRLKMDADPVCGSSHKEAPYRQSFIMNDKGYLKNVMVYLKDVDYKGNAPSTQAILDQKGCIYEPHVQGIMVGQELLIKNSDATLHNIHGLPIINSEFNFAMPKVVKEKTIKFAKPEHAIYIKCDVHPWMKSYVSVFDHPYFSVTDNEGNYKIDNIPPGTYEVVAWQEKFKDKKTKAWKTLNATVTIGEGNTTQNFTYIVNRRK